MHSKKLNETIERCKRNDRNAQFDLYKQYSKAMYNVSLRMTKNVEDAEDVLQDSFVKAFGNLDSYKYEATFGAWLKRIVINTSISHLNKNRLFFDDIDDHNVIVEDDGLRESHYSLEKIKRAIAELPEGYRIIFSMYAIEGCDHQEIAEFLGITTSTSKSQYSRAKKKLRETLKGENRMSQIC